LDNATKQLQSLMNGRPTHAAIHPTSAYSVTPSLVPYPETQQSCRTAYSNKMINQIIHKRLGDPFEHSAGYEIAGSTRSLVNPSTFNISGLQEEIGGQTLTVGFLATYENQEDACVIDRSIIERGLFRYRQTIIIKETLKGQQFFGRVVNGSQNPHHLRHMSNNGIPHTNVYVSHGDCVIGKYELIESELNGEKVLIREDKSYYLAREERGIITEVVTYNTYKAGSNVGLPTVSVRIVAYSSSVRGNKFSTRHSQKHIAALLRSHEDMPFRTDGSSINIIFSPMCVPTRMTMGTLLEPITGKATSITGSIHDMAAHKKRNIEDIKQTLQRAGFSSNGKERIKDGTTGMTLEAEVFVGLMRVNMLAHIAEEKVQCRSVGKKDKITNQAAPTKFGNAQNKGQKIGEAERNNLIQYHSRFLIQERMNLSCDGVTVVVCLQCSSFSSFQPNTGKFACPICSKSVKGSAKSMFGKYIMPQTTMYFRAGLLSIGTLLQPKFVTAVEYLEGRPVTEGTDIGVEEEYGEEDIRMDLD